MTTVDDGTGRQLCTGCAAGQCPDDCRDEHCQCGCRSPLDVRERARRARELDGRRPDKLATIAAELEAETRPDAGPDPAEVQALTRERFAPRLRRRCRSCGAPIVWSSTGMRAMPVDPDPAAGGNLLLKLEHNDRLTVQVVRPGDGTHRAHWASCPHADDWRSR